jgi:DNA excision repair protein ERCC-4
MKPPQIGTNTTLIMCSSTSTATTITDFLKSIDRTRNKGEWGRQMMMRKLRSWVYQKARASANSTATATSGSSSSQQGTGKAAATPAAGAAAGDDDDGLSEALKKKDREKAARMGSRRRIRGGALAAGVIHQQNSKEAVPGAVESGVGEDL